jgi:plasmid stabilization system protein ParE
VRVVWSAWALRQLDEIRAWYSAETTPTVADRIIEDILAGTSLLE